MRILDGVFENFGSYENLIFDYSEPGLTLVSGSTGSGKSTLMDAVAWTLFGETSKNIQADDIKSWNSAGVTRGSVIVETFAGSIIVVRTRGKPSDNDIYWVELNKSEEGKEIRGKDVNETQSLLESRLGISSELYFTAAYFHQFSSADSFFVAKSKERRELLEKIADLSLPVKIAEASRRRNKEVNDSLKKAQNICIELSSRLATLNDEYEKNTKLQVKWEKSKEDNLKFLKSMADNFQLDKQKKLEVLMFELNSFGSIEEKFNHNRLQREKIENIDDKLSLITKEMFSTKLELKHVYSEIEKYSKNTSLCPTCLGDYNNPNRREHLYKLQAQIQDLESKQEIQQKSAKKYQTETLNKAKLFEDYEELMEEQVRYEKLKSTISVLENSVNIHLKDMENIKSSTNPYLTTQERLSKELEETVVKYSEANNNANELNLKSIQLNQLYDLSMDFRGVLLKKTVEELERNTNFSLNSYFDGEIKVSFTLEGEKLEAKIEKNGYPCSFKQLSGGQRCMLKLCFGVSLMKAASNKAGIHFDNLFFDESLNGLDNDLKIKAFSLFQNLEKEHKSIMLIEHSEEFKSMFTNRYNIRLEGDSSTVEQISEI